VRKPLMLLATCLTLFCLLMTAPALAQDYPPDVEGEGQEIAPAQETEGELPTTGANMTLFAATGLLAVGTGVYLVRRTRARREGTERI
jgi:LPXTG-motif cell wall-anchored protein